jgi:Fe2+ transport system protein FeoA
MSRLLNVVPLHLLHPGESGQICDVSGDDHLVRRLDEMGLRVGVSIRMVQPGEPCIVAVDHQRLSFRGEDHAVILVEVERT